ncbi:hypothetical protein ATCC90586_006683 [Pythium insidiosum]|nr:hypothetical protein ATCC90586_006683 [Pythium insidiosum]
MVDSLLALLASPALSLASLQLVLVEHTCQPDVAQRVLLTDVWRELLCYWWRDDVVIQALQVLMETATHTVHDAVRRDIVEFIAQVFPELPAAAQAECLAIVTQTVDAWLREGPSCRADATSSTSLALLDRLNAASFLAHYELPDKEEWIATFLRLSVECIGTALDQLRPTGNADDAMVAGLLRVLDVGLLVVKAALSADAQDEGTALGAVLLPMSCEVVGRLAAVARQSPAVVDSIERLLRQTLDVLSQFATELKRNRDNQCVQLVKDLLALVDATLRPSGVALAIASFVEQALSDVLVTAPSDLSVASTLWSRLCFRLTALHFGLERAALPPFVVPHAHAAFGRFLEAAATGQVPEESVDESYAGVDQAWTQRFPTADSLDDASMDVDAEAPSRLESGDDDQAADDKRLKWALVQTLQQRLVGLARSVDADELLRRVDDAELDALAAALEPIVARLGR